MRPACLKVISALRRKKRGVTVGDFARGFRLAARVHELRSAGFAIKTEQDEVSDGVLARYVLVGEP